MPLRLTFVVFLFVVTVAHVSYGNDKTTSPPEEYQHALQLIHAFNGAGDELILAMQIADRLSRTHPEAGYAETLRAEALSTWQLDQQGEPAELRAHVIALTDEALRRNGNLAQAHVARARALLRASQYDQANTSVEAALKLDPHLDGAIFIRAEIFRRTAQLIEAETWYLKFVVATPQRPRKSNGYYWLGQAYEEAARRTPSARDLLIRKARIAYERMLELDPEGPWKNVNFAIFLNEDTHDFDAAEKYAAKALDIMEFPMARYHLAIARYQKLLPELDLIDDRRLNRALVQVHESTGISFEDAFRFAQTYSQIRERLQGIQARMRRN